MTKIETPTFTPFLYSKESRLDNVKKKPKKKELIRNHSAKTHFINRNRLEPLDEDDEDNEIMKMVQKRRKK